MTQNLRALLDSRVRAAMAAVGVDRSGGYDYAGGASRIRRLPGQRRDAGRQAVAPESARAGGRGRRRTRPRGYRVERRHRGTRVRQHPIERCAARSCSGSESTIAGSGGATKNGGHRLLVTEPRQGDARRSSAQHDHRRCDGARAHGARRTRDSAEPRRRLGNAIRHVARVSRRHGQRVRGVGGLGAVLSGRETAFRCGSGLCGTRARVCRRAAAGRTARKRVVASVHRHLDEPLRRRLSASRHRADARRRACRERLQRRTARYRRRAGSSRFVDPVGRCAVVYSSTSSTRKTARRSPSSCRKATVHTSTRPPTSPQCAIARRRCMPIASCISSTRASHCTSGRFSRSRGAPDSLRQKRRWSTTRSA